MVCPYHPRGWAGVLPGPGLAHVLGAGAGVGGAEGRGMGGMGWEGTGLGRCLCFSLSFLCFFEMCFFVFFGM